MVNTGKKKPLSSFPAEAGSPRGAVLRVILGYGYLVCQRPWLSGNVWQGLKIGA